MERDNAKTTAISTSLRERMRELEGVVQHLQHRVNNQDSWLRQLYIEIGLDYPGDIPEPESGPMAGGVQYPG